MSKYNIFNQHIVLLRVAWMDKYNGVSDIDIPSGAGSYVEQNQNGGEVYNFSKKRGRYYGFARIQKDRTIDLTKLGATKDSKEIKGITVVFFAKNPVDGGQWIVGWYKNATLYKGLRQCPKKNKFDFGYCIATCNTKDGRLLEIDERNWEIEGAGQTNLWHIEKKSPKDVKQLKTYIKTGKIIKKKQPVKPKGGGWQKDVELRKKIEYAAMEKVVSVYSNKGFTCEYVHKENKGWDIEISKGKRKFQVEVKGTQFEFNTVELTPNEYNMMKSKKKTYRVCVVSNALNSKKIQLDTFHFDGHNWINERNNILNITEVVSAKLNAI